jgi:hypothetical protein
MEAEIGVVWPEAKDTKVATATRSWGKQGQFNFSLEELWFPSTETLTSDFWPVELWKNNILHVKTLSLQ